MTDVHQTEFLPVHVERATERVVEFDEAFGWWCVIGQDGTILTDGFESYAAAWRWAQGESDGFGGSTATVRFNSASGLWCVIGHDGIVVAEDFETRAAAVRWAQGELE